MAACYACGTKFPANLVIERSTECPSCSKPVRCCRNCTFYEPGAHWDCRETIPDPVYDKERSNFCDYFRLRPDHSKKDSSTNAQARAAFDDLFS